MVILWALVYDKELWWESGVSINCLYTHLFFYMQILMGLIIFQEDQPFIMPM